MSHVSTPLCCCCYLKFCFTGGRDQEGRKEAKSVNKKEEIWRCQFKDVILEELTQLRQHSSKRQGPVKAVPEAKDSEQTACLKITQPSGIAEWKIYKL